MTTTTVNLKLFWVEIPNLRLSDTLAKNVPKEVVSIYFACMCMAMPDQYA